MTDNSFSLSRRGFLSSAAAVGLSALGLAGCGSGTGSSGSATGGGGGGGGKALQWWSFDEGRVAIARHVTQSAAFKQLHPDVTVEFQQFTWAQMHDKLLAALVSGRGAPDVADVEIQRFPQFIGGGTVPFMDLTQRIGSDIDKLARSAATDPWTWKGKTYGVGTELNAVTFTYRKDVMDDLGIKTPFETWDQVVAAGRKVAAGGKMKMFALHDQAVFDWDMITQVMGGSFFDTSGEFSGDSEQGVAALTWLRDLVHKEKIADIAPATAANNYNGPEYWAAFKAEKYAAIFGPAWLFTGLVKNVPQQAGKWRMQTLPTGLGAGRPTAFAGGTGQCITSQSKHADVAWDIIKLTNFSSDSSKFEFTNRGVFPTYKPAFQEAWLKSPSQYFGGQRIGDIYAEVADKIPAWSTSPKLYKGVDAIVRLAITPVMNARKDAAPALADVRKSLDQLKTS